MEKFKKILSLEIGIEIKACLYFAIILFYYFLYCFLQGNLYASIVLMIEMVLTTYAMSYLQVYFLHNFDEAEHFSKKAVFSSVLCAAVYTAVSWLLNWFDKNKAATIGYFFYMLFCYICVCLIYKIKRDIDTMRMNQELEHFKERKQGDRNDN